MKPNDARELKTKGNDGDDESNRRRVEKVYSESRAKIRKMKMSNPTQIVEAMKNSNEKFNEYSGRLKRRMERQIE